LNCRPNLHLIYGHLQVNFFEDCKRGGRSHTYIEVFSLSAGIWYLIFISLLLLQRFSRHYEFNVAYLNSVVNLATKH